MKEKVIWLIASCLMVVALLLASCAPAVTEEEEEVVTPEEEVVTPEEEVTPVAEKPEYGGTLVIWWYYPLSFDDAYTSQAYCFSLHVTNECLLIGDWTKGPAGTGETLWVHSGWDTQLMTGSLAESWEYRDPSTIVLHIRKGVHFHDKPPVNGREMTADDVAFSIQRDMEVSVSPYQDWVGPWFESVEATDKWTVVVKGNEEGIGRLTAERDILNWMRIFPREMVEKYGDMKDWRNSCGTGPFILTDSVVQSSLTFDRNPNYWMKDPLHPENTLPYVDQMKWLMIGDTSTREAAFRTGKLDLLITGWEPGQALLEQIPDLQYSKALAGTMRLFQGRTDTGLPFTDHRVRRALHMAVDNEAIVRDYYNGEAEMLSYPMPPLPEFKDFQIPFDELPQSIRELYGYHPDKAKQLLAEAGYPDGFNTAVICTQGDVDLLSIYSSYWADIGVVLDIQVREGAVLTSIRLRDKYEEMITVDMSTGLADMFRAVDPDQRGTNMARVSDPYINEKLAELWSFENSANRAKQAQLAKEITLHTLEQGWTYGFPTAYSYTLWWPWLKGYHGELTAGTQSTLNWSQFIWLDQGLKEQMTGRR